MATRPDGKELIIAGRVYVELCQVSYEWNDLEKASEQVNRSIALCRQWGNETYQAIGFLMLAQLEWLRNHQQSAVEAMHKAEKLANQPHVALFYTTKVRAVLARMWFVHGNLEQASRIVQDSGITTKDEIIFLREPEFLALLRLLLARGEYADSLALSRRLLEKAEASKRIGRMIEVLVLQSLIYQDRKELDPALAVLKKALTLAKPERYIRTFLDEGEPMVRLLHMARSRQIETEYVTSLLSAVKEDIDTTPPPQLQNESLTVREVEVLKLIEAGYSNQELAEELIISITTVKRHISNIYTKLGVKNRTQAVAIGKELKLFN